MSSILEKKEGDNANKSVGTLNPIDYFSQDTVFVFVYKKTEKLATALYMITNLFSDTEPMKWSVRAKVSQLLSFILGFKDIVQSREHEFSHEVKTRVLEIVSLLEISSRSGLVSPMNFSIIKVEFMNLLNTLSHIDTTREQKGYALAQTFFDIQEVENSTSEKEGDNIGHNNTGHGKMRQQNVLKGAVEKNIMSFNPTHEFKKTNRQTIIINLLKKKKDLTIKDISLVIKDCSEKTIQRELMVLIERGVLRKVGERRWSRYSLVESVI